MYYTFKNIVINKNIIIIKYNATQCQGLPNHYIYDLLIQIKTLTDLKKMLIINNDGKKKNERKKPDNNT